MALLSDQQRGRAVEVLKEYLSASTGPDGRTPTRIGEETDQQRVEIIDRVLLPLLTTYLNGQTSLADFKTRVDSTNKRNQLWGFKGIKGQMFFNVLLNVAPDEAELDQELKIALKVPGNDQEAASRIRTFASYARRIGDEWVGAGNTGYGKPKLGSIPFFLSYFWQIQDRAKWPVYFTNSVQTLTDLNIWQPKDDLAEDYLSYKAVHEELRTLFCQSTGKPFDLYQVEHVFWFKGGNPYGTTSVPPVTINGKAAVIEETAISVALAFDSYIPPIVANLPLIASHSETMTEAARRSGSTVDRAFEKAIDAAFTMLGYETKLLGQGKGRVPDGLAKAMDESYAILWDAKVRSGGYSIGTDDRVIREYITTQSRELKRSRTFRNIYYVIVSSSFSEDYDDLIRSIKMETDVNEVILMEASALVAVVDAKLRQPLQISLGPDGLQRLFTTSGILTADLVREELS